MKDLTAKVGQYDQTIVKIYGTGENKKIKITNLAYLRTKGVEEDEKHIFDLTTPDEANEISSEDAEDEAKLRESIARAKQKIFELAFCNEWDYFFTGTIDQTKYDRNDLEQYHKELTKWLCNKARGKEKIEYLFVPELHKNGGWHLHGFILGIDANELVEYKRGMKMNASIFQKVQEGDEVYQWTSYDNKFGYSAIEPIKNTEAISKYIQKYMSKDLGVHVSKIGAHLYYHSRGLNFAEFVCVGSNTEELTLPPPNFTSDYCKVWWLPYSEDLESALKDEIIKTEWRDSTKNFVQNSQLNSHNFV